MVSQIANYAGNVILADGIQANAPQSITLTSNVGTSSSYFMICTTPSLATAAAGNQTEVITLPGITATNIADVQYVGGTNTTTNINFKAACTANTITVTIYNNSASALNGTVIFTVTVN